MKHIYNILWILCPLIFFACQADDELGGGKTGYLRLTVTEDAGTQTRAVPEDYKPEQIAVQIVNEAGTVVDKTEDWKLWEGKPIELQVGTYTIKAASNGFDGKAADFEIPYYAGSKEITIAADSELNETITCTLANVKVTVDFDEALLAKVKSVAATVQSKDEAYSLNFVSTETRSAYFPVTDLMAQITVVTDKGSNTLEQALTDPEGNPAKARDHFILNIREADSNTSQITVTVDPTTHEYSYTFNVSTVPTEKASLTAGAWDRLAYLKAENVSTGSGVSSEGIKFQYRVKPAESAQSDEDSAPWTDIETTSTDMKYTAMLTGLTAETEYEYRLVNGENVAIGNAGTFTTSAADARTVLPNGNFEDWCERSAGTALGNKQTTFPCTETDYDSGDRFWDTSNRGANSAGQRDPTNKTTELVKSGTYAAKLQSTSILGKMAAASLYVGDFGTAKISGSATINFGKSFTSRPISLKGYYKYSPVKMTVVDRMPEGVTLVEGETMDECAIYIALTTDVITVDNADVNSLFNPNDDAVIAYGELPSGAATSGEDYIPFEIPLKYKEGKFDVQPTHIVIVCSASKYGDYMSGGDGSVMYLDDFSLVYDGEPEIWVKE